MIVVSLFQKNAVRKVEATTVDSSATTGEPSGTSTTLIVCCVVGGLLLLLVIIGIIGYLVYVLSCSLNSETKSSFQMEKILSTPK